MHRLHHRQPDVSIDAAASVPARIRDVLALHPHGDHVLLAGRPQVRREVVFEIDITIGSAAEMRAVQPDVAVAIDALEAQEDPFPGRRFRQHETLPIPSRAARKKPGRTGEFLGEPALDRPIMRQ